VKAVGELYPLCGGIYVAPTFVSSLHRRELDVQRHINPLGSGWLGSVSLSAANIYAEIDLEVKANDLAKSALVPEIKSLKRWREQPTLMAFLRRSQSISYVAFEAPFAATEATGGPRRHINPGAT
jgi:hypothetical protein